MRDLNARVPGMYGLRIRRFCKKLACLVRVLWALPDREAVRCIYHSCEAILLLLYGRRLGLGREPGKYLFLIIRHRRGCAEPHQRHAGLLLEGQVRDCLSGVLHTKLASAQSWMVLLITGLPQSRIQRRLACGSMVLTFFVFSLCERKNEKQKEDKVPLRITTSRSLRKSCLLE